MLLNNKEMKVEKTKESSFWVCVRCRKQISTYYNGCECHLLFKKIKNEEDFRKQLFK